MNALTHASDQAMRAASVILLPLAALLLSLTLLGCARFAAPRATLTPKQTYNLERQALQAKSLRPVTLVGAALIIAALALVYFHWVTKALIVGGCGAAMILLASILPGNDRIIITVGLATALIAALAVAWAYWKGAFDARAEKNSRVESPPPHDLD